MTTKKCKQCGELFAITYPDNRVYYCPKCAKKRRYRKAPHPIVKCPVCSKTFSQKNSLHKFDTLKCKNKYHSELYQNKLNSLAKRCGFCGKAFMTYKSNKEYCCKTCYDRAKRKREAKNRYNNEI